MDDQIFILIYDALLICFFLSLFVAVFAVRGSIRARRAAKERKLKGERLTSSHGEGGASPEADGRALPHAMRSDTTAPGAP